MYVSSIFVSPDLFQKLELCFPLVKQYDSSNLNHQRIQGEHLNPQRIQGQHLQKLRPI